MQWVTSRTISYRVIYIYMYMCMFLMKYREMETQVSQPAEHKTLVTRAFLSHKRFDASWTWRMDFTRRDRSYSNVHFVVRAWSTATRESVWTFFWSSL